MKERRERRRNSKKLSGRGKQMRTVDRAEQRWNGGQKKKKKEQGGGCEKVEEKSVEEN